MLTHLSLFSGIGGLDLAAEMAGFVTVGQCEWADYPTKILEQHWPDVPRWRDIRTLTKESFYEKTGLRTVDVVSGGFPCQPFSVAGKRGGEADDRYLWPEMCRVIRELRPTWVLGENVPGIINLALDTVLADLENEGYTAQAFVVPACGVDAPHKRDRVAILAYAKGKRGAGRMHGSEEDASGNGGQGSDHGRGEAQFSGGQRREDEPRTDRVADGIRAGVHDADPDADVQRLQGRSCGKIFRGVLQTQSNRIRGMHSPWEDWPAEPDIPRVSYGVSNRVDRIRCLGNAVVPQQFYLFFKLMADIEEKAKDDHSVTDVQPRNDAREGQLGRRDA